SYSSQAPIYGGIAAGWQLTIPDVHEDTSLGRMRLQDTAHNAPIYTSSLTGSRPFIHVTEPTGMSAGTVEQFRAQNDASFTRWERLSAASGSPFWRAFTTDGTVHYFGETATDALNNHANGCSNIGYNNAPLTRSEDAFGN